MRKIIKKVLKEDMDWINDVDPIRKILKEEGFDWAVDTPSYDDMKIGWEEHVLPYLTGQRPVYDDEGDILDFDRWPEISREEREDLEPLAKHYFVRELNDIDFKDGKFIMTVGSWSEFAEMFKDCDYQGYVCRYTAEQALGGDMDWEPYYDVVHDWMDQVWDGVNSKQYDAIVTHIRKWMIGDTLTDEFGEEYELTEELLTSWLGEKETLGHMINNEVGSGFEDLRNSMKWAYESAYNDAARDEYWNSTHDAIKGVVGKGEWEEYKVKKMDGEVTRHQLIFDVTDIFMDVIQTYFDDYAELDYDHEQELEYDGFLDNLIFLMNEDLYDEPLNPSVSEWPDSDKVSEYMNDRIFDDLG